MSQTPHTAAHTSNNSHSGGRDGEKGVTGGAWEIVVDKAVASITEYLCSTTSPFDPAAPLSQHMLHLLDRGSLRDVLVERNYNELCGYLGCGNKPRGLTGGGAAAVEGGTLSFDWASSSSDDAEEHDIDEAGVGDVTESSRAATKSAGKLNSTTREDERPDEADAEEIVYEEDMYTAESFRMAQQQQALLHRMQRKKQLRDRNAVLRAARGVTESPIATPLPHAPVGPQGAALSTPHLLRSGLLGACFSQRFCCPECEELYKFGILPRVPAHFNYDYPSLLSAITNLFPNLRVEVLQQLAGAEACAEGLVKPIHEKMAVNAGAAAAQEDGKTTEPSLKSVQIGCSYESSEHFGNLSRRGTAHAATTTAAARHPMRPNVSVSNTDGTGRAMKGDTPSSHLMRDVLEQMHVLQHIWRHEVHQGLINSHSSPSISHPTSGDVHDNERGVAALSPQPRLPRPALRGSLLLIDFIMSVSSVKTQRLFRWHYAQHRNGLRRGIANAAPPTAATRSLFYEVSAATVAAMETKVSGEAAPTPSGTASPVDGGHDLREADGVDGVRVDATLQGQRRDLLVTHIFSEDVTAALSRLLLVDYGVVAQAAWSAVWFKEVVTASLEVPRGQKSEACSLLRSLRFPFAIPAVLLQAAGSSPEVLGLALIFLVAAGCCSEEVWRGCMAEGVAFDEVAEAIGLTREDVVTAVRLLMLDGDD